MALIDDEDDCFAVDEVTQRAMFGRVAAVVHHGGAGITRTATRADVPRWWCPSGRTSRNRRAGPTTKTPVRDVPETRTATASFFLPRSRAPARRS